MKLLKPNIDLTQYGFKRTPNGWRYDMSNELSILITDGTVMIWSYVEYDTQETHDDRWVDFEHTVEVPKVLFEMYKDGVVGWNE